MRVSDEQIRTYRNQGFLIIPGFLTQAETDAALAGFHRLYAPSYDEWIASRKSNETPRQGLFPWDDSGLNHAATHPDIIDAAERIIGTREIRLCEAHLGVKYAGDKDGFGYHIDYGNNTLGPELEKDDFCHPLFFYSFDEVTKGLAPIMMVPNGGGAPVPMICPRGSLCIYSIYTSHSASPFTAARGQRCVMWVGMSRRDRPWDGARTFTYKTGATEPAMSRFIREANPRQLELLGFPPPGDSLWTDSFLEGMARRYAGFNPEPYRKQLAAV
jgi:hypothetical protein